MLRAARHLFCAQAPRLLAACSYLLNRRQSDILGRPEAIRRLAELGLKVKK
jgi:hypothetical protein